MPMVVENLTTCYRIKVSGELPNLTLSLSDKKLKQVLKVRKIYYHY